MRFTSTLVLSSVLYVAGISATGSNPTGCNANNCLRAVRATRLPRDGSADCQSYFQTTVSSGPTTTVTIIPTDIPDYASACSGSVKYSSACSCVGATPVIIDVTPTCPPGQKICPYGSGCQDILSDPNNCGDCGVTCPSGSCVNGQCAVSSCNGSVCGSLNSCANNCFCFQEASGLGFCGPNVSCAPLKDCNVNSDCAQGEVCAIGTCCTRNVCLSSCATLRRRSFPHGFVARGDDERWTGGSPPA